MNDSLADLFAGMCCGVIIGLLILLALPEIAGALAMWVGP